MGTTVVLALWVALQPLTGNDWSQPDPIGQLAMQQQGQLSSPTQPGASVLAAGASRSESPGSEASNQGKGSSKQQGTDSQSANSQVGSAETGSRATTTTVAAIAVKAPLRDTTQAKKKAKKSTTSTTSTTSPTGRSGGARGTTTTTLPPTTTADTAGRAKPTTTTTTSTTTTTTTAPAPKPIASAGGGVVWRADMESGNLNEWDGFDISRNGDAYASTRYAKSGRYSMAMEVTNASSGTAVRAKAHDVDGYSGATNLPNDAYYSAWFYIPSYVHVGDGNGNGSSDGWNIFQWKQAGYRNGNTHLKLLEAIKLVDWGNGYGLRLQTRTSSSGQWIHPEVRTIADSKGPLVGVGQWFHIEARRVWHETNGRITVWVNGKQLWDLTGIKTLYDVNDSDWRYNWTSGNRSRFYLVNNYVTDDHRPNSHILYVDDARIALNRQGP